MFIKVAIHAILGLAISILLAVACALWMPTKLVQHHTRSHDNAVNPWIYSGKPGGAPPQTDAQIQRRVDRMTSHADASWRARYRDVIKAWPPSSQESTLQHAGFGMTFDQFSVDTMRVLGHFWCARTGWPWPCLQTAQWSTSIDNQPGRLVPQSRGYVKPPMWLHARYRNKSDEFIPCSPVWQGLILNTIVFGLATWLLVAIPPWLRRVQRIRRGRCPDCGYDRAGLQIGGACPECGLIPAK